MAMGGIGTSGANAPSAAASSAKPTGVEKKTTSNTSGTTRAKRLHNLRLQNAINPGPSADADCYTCRRRRVRCDRALPTCRKCAKADHECAGYKKGFRWVGGIASRGKMMGKSTFDGDSMEDNIGHEGEPVLHDSGVTTTDATSPPSYQGALTSSSSAESSSSPSSNAGVTHLRDLVVPSISPRASYSYLPMASPDTMQDQMASISRAPVDFAAVDFAQQFSFNQPLQLSAPDTNSDPVDVDDFVFSNSSFSTGNTPDTVVGTVAKQWTYYFSSSVNYSFSRARSGQYYFIVPKDELNSVYGKQYTLGLSVGPPVIDCSPEFDIPIASLIDFYVSTPSAAPSMIGSLDACARYYLSFFDQMCGIFLLFDRQPLNPYRELLLSTLHFSEPALLSTILAVSARYHANVTGHHYNSTSLRPDLIYYNQALNYLNQDLQDEERMLVDTTLASVLFFLFYETMDSGLDTWRVHLSGARKLVELKRKRMEMNAGNLTHMQAFILHSIALFDIIGSTLVTDRQPSVLALPSISGISGTSNNSLASTNYTPAMSTTTALNIIDNDVFPILVQGEMFCFLVCPPEILQIILKITLLSSHSYLTNPQSTLPEAITQEFLDNRATLVHQISNFDSRSWMEKHQGGLTITAGEEDLWHHVEAYKTAVLIYLYRSLFLPNEIEKINHSASKSHCKADTIATLTNPGTAPTPPLSLPTLTTLLFHHLDQIPITGSLYKGTVWPCFIAGTEARTKTQKSRVRKHFETLWKVLYCLNVRNGMRVLEELWGEPERNGEGEVMGGRIIEEEEDEEEDTVEEEEGAVEKYDETDEVNGDGGGEMKVRGGEVDDGVSTRARTRTSNSNSSSSSSASVRGQDWKSYLKRKGVEWLII